MRAIPTLLSVALVGGLLLSACTVVEAPLSVIGTAVDVTGTLVETTVDVATYPLRDSDD
ncbi:MAG: hypothetical protein K9H25_13320 [Rhodospirillum sp.]|nr:hypothetical protein [Rhodospirillum sp.]MCF8490593.1 hypothetical protein [Rhodospirillum sp.]MCF8498960.1 hypothetical protein [Rhodospirillum sp.]